jgi:hypothetical protein
MSTSIGKTPLKQRIDKLVQLVDKLECSKKQKKTKPNDIILDPDPFKGQGNASVLQVL